MEVWLNESAARIRPGFRKILGDPCPFTGKREPIILDKWHKRPSEPFVDKVTGECTPGPKTWSRSKTRGKTGKFTVASARRMKFNALSFDPVWMITLTYGDIPNPRRCYTDLNRYLTWLRSRGITQYLWVAEMQSRGALHFHIILPDGNYRKLLWSWVGVCVDGTQYCRPLACVAWGRCSNQPIRTWVSCGRIERIRSVQGGRSYVQKYLSKGSNQDWNGRRWGSNRVARLRAKCNLVVRTYFRLVGTKMRDMVFGRGTVQYDLIVRLFSRIEGDFQKALHAQTTCRAPRHSKPT